MPSVKDPKKLCRDMFREYGAHVRGRTERHGGTEYLFPDMTVIVLPANATMAWYVAQKRNLAAKFGPLVHERASYTKRSGRPEIDFGKLRASAHAQDRLKLMRSQTPVEFKEVLHALRLPESVLWSDEHQSWLWTRGRISVAVSEDGSVITTVMWATAELFERFPRPA